MEMPKYNTSLKIKLHTFKQQPKPVHCDPVESKQLDYQMMEERLMVQHKHAIAQNSDTSLLHDPVDPIQMLTASCLIQLQETKL
jgi:hypothetical protein